MAGVRIVTDSSCDLSKEEAERHHIDIVPLSIRFGSTEYTDREELTVEEFYKKMAASDALPETAAPAPGAFEQAFRKARTDGADTVMCITISSELSATMQSAQNAARSIGDDFPVEVIDSRSITSGLGTIVLEAARLAGTGADAGAVRKLVDDLIPRTRVFGALHTLENLKKGGRIGGARAMLGSMLSIKPIIDISTGVVEEAAKARTRTKSLAWLYDRMKADGAIEHVAIHHGDAQDIEDFLTLISPDFPRERIRLGKIGAVIGTHGGPEIIGATWVTPPD